MVNIVYTEEVHLIVAQSTKSVALILGHLCQGRGIAFEEDNYVIMCHDIVRIKMAGFSIFEILQSDSSLW